MTEMREGQNRGKTRSPLGPDETATQIHVELSLLYRATQGMVEHLGWAEQKADE